jgi:hypothetical protein
MVKRSNKRTSEETRALLDAADALATFAHLDPDGVENFRRRYPEFVPETWWIGPSWKEGVGVYIPWMRERDLLYKAWKAAFPTELTLELATTALFLISHAMTSDTTEEMEKNQQRVWAYQRALLFLSAEQWRAKICEECGNPFVADHASRKYCSVAGADGKNCSALVIKRTGLEWGRENNWGRPTSKAKKLGHRGAKNA